MSFCHLLRMRAKAVEIQKAHFMHRGPFSSFHPKILWDSTHHLLLNPRTKSNISTVLQTFIYQKVLQGPNYYNSINPHATVIKIEGALQETGCNQKAGSFFFFFLPPFSIIMLVDQCFVFLHPFPLPFSPHFFCQNNPLSFDLVHLALLFQE